MKIRQAKEQDIEAIVSLSLYLLKLHNSIDEEYFSYEENHEESVRTWIRQHLTSDNQFIFVAEDKTAEAMEICGFITGYIKYLFPWYRLKSVGHISFLTVLPYHQKKGVGKLLEKQAVSWFKNRDQKYIEVYTNEQNPAGSAAWKAYGYQPFNKFLRKKIG